NRAGVSVGGEPLLLTRWSQPMAGNREVIEKTGTLARELNHLGRASIPAGVALGVNGRIAFRSLRGVKVLDAATGKLLWETTPPNDEEQMLSRLRSSNEYENRFQRSRFYMQSAE